MTHSRTYLLIRTAVRAAVLIAIYAVVCLDSPVLH